MPEVDVNDLTPNLSDPSTSIDSVDEVDSPKDDDALNTNIQNNGDEKVEEEEEWADILDNGQLKMKILKQGEPDTRPQPLDLCNIKLTGKLDSGEIVEEYDSLQIQLGDHEVIQGLEMALPLMNVGEQTMVVVASRFAYGSLGNLSNIPPDATITYIVELLKVDFKPDLETIPYERRKVLANTKRERGNWWYSRQDATKAVQCYRRALDILDESVLYVDDNGKTFEITEEMLKDLIQQRLMIYNNLAAAQLLLGAYESALSSVNEVIKHDPNNVKALFRKSKILTARGHINGAVDALRQASVIDPENTAVRVELFKCMRLQQIEKKHEKNLYKKMLGQSQKDNKSRPGSKGKSSLWTKVIGTAATATLLAAVAVAISYKYKNYPFP